MISYMEIVGTKAPGRVNSDLLEQLVEKTLAVIGADAVKEIRSNLDAAEFKKPTGNLSKAARFEVNRLELEVSIDEQIAPYAPHVERGVHTHVMRYLAKATRPIPVDMSNPKCKVFRWAKESDMGRQHTYIDECTGEVKTASGWVHPGYEGKWFFKNAIDSVIGRIGTYSKALVIQVRQEEEGE